jgi:hypothetical protein
MLMWLLNLGFAASAIDDVEPEPEPTHENPYFTHYSAQPKIEIQSLAERIVVRSV